MNWGEGENQEPGSMGEGKTAHFLQQSWFVSVEIYETAVRNFGIIGKLLNSRFWAEAMAVWVLSGLVVIALPNVVQWIQHTNSVCLSFKEMFIDGYQIINQKVNRTCDMLRRLWKKADIIIIQCVLLLTEISLGAMQNKNTGVK